MVDLSSNINLDFKAFWRWWLRELGLLVPDKLKRLFNDKQGFLLVLAEDQGLALVYADD